MKKEFNENLSLNLKTLRLLNVYDLDGFSDELLEKCRYSVFGEVVTRPVDRRENYVKRCIGIAGDTLQIVNGQVRINGKNAEKIPEFVRLLEQKNRKAKGERRYIDGFPMQYKGIDYLYEYSGRVVLGINPAQSKFGQERYREVYELLFDKGVHFSQNQPGQALTGGFDIGAIYNPLYI